MSIFPLTCYDTILIEAAYDECGLNCHVVVGSAYCLKSDALELLWSHPTLWYFQAGHFFLLPRQEAVQL